MYSVAQYIEGAAMKASHPIALRFTDEDIEILAKLRKVTGLSAVSAVRLAIREALASRRPPKR